MLSKVIKENLIFKEMKISHYYWSIFDEIISYRMRALSIIFLFVFSFSPDGFSQEDQLGKINFEAVGHEVAQPYFNKGMLLLHNFEYKDAAQEFDMAQLLDPDFVMAYWGEAMCYNHPLWYQQDYEKGRGALYKLGVKLEERVNKAQTDLEKDFIRSIEHLYGEEKDLRKRNASYQSKMEELYIKYEGEEEVAAFYALSILGNSYSDNEKENYTLAGKVLMKLNATNPDHPGALNYMIHLYDDPAQAYKGKKAADTYFGLAKDSKYALHAPSHIFLANGEWAKVVTSNEAAWASTEAWVKKKKKSLEDRDYHSLWWLQYGYLMQGEYSKALELVKNLSREGRYSKSERLRFHLAMMRGHYLVESNNWLNEVTQIEIPTKGFSASTKNMCFFVDAMAAMALNDLPKVGWYINQMTDQRMVEQNQNGPFNDFRSYSTTPIQRSTGMEQELALAECMEWELHALLALKALKYEEAIDHIKKAVALEDKTNYEPGPAVVLKPSHEIYGEILLASGNANSAIEQFDLSLKRAPNRSMSLLGKYKALKSLGENEKAAQVRTMLKNNWKDADEKALKLLN